MCRGRELTLNPKWGFSFRPLPLSLEAHLLRRDEQAVRANVKDDPRKPCLPGTQYGCTHELRDWLHIPGLHGVKPDMVPTLRKGGGHRLPHLSKKLYATDNAGKGTSQLSTMECH